MLLQSLLSLGTLAVSASGFLVPFQFDESKNSPNPLGINSLHKDAADTVTLDCSSCPYALKAQKENGKREWEQGVPSDLELEFRVKDNRLQINGVPVFPIQSPAQPPPLLTVAQKAKDGDVVATGEDGDVADLAVSYSLEVIQKGDKSGNSLLTITMSVLALDGEMIRVDDVEIQLIKVEQGNMLLLHSATPVATSPDAPDAKCANVLCRIMTKFAATVQKAKAAAKTAAHKVKSHCAKCFRCLLRMMHHKGKHHANHGAGVPQPPAEGSDRVQIMRPGKHHKQHHHNHQHMRHRGFVGRMAHVLAVTFKIVFVPILVGVAFGMAASALGMLVGQAVVFLWMRYRRAPAGGAYQAVPVDVKEEVPPPYEDVPAIKVSDEKEIEEKA